MDKEEQRQQAILNELGDSKPVAELPQGRIYAINDGFVPKPICYERTFLECCETVSEAEMVLEDYCARCAALDTEISIEDRS